MRMGASDPRPEASAPRFAVGTRVANPLEGRTGHIDSVDPEQRAYHLVFSDGFETTLEECDVEQFVVREQPPADPLELKDATVERKLVRYDGVETRLKGTVVSFFEKEKKYRVVYENHWTQDVSLEEIPSLVVANANLQAAGENEDRYEDNEVDGERPAKRAKTGENGSAEDVIEAPSIVEQKFPSRSAAYTILRRVLSLLLAQDGVRAFGTDRQRMVLTNDDIKPKRALEQFVEADGLKFLRRVLHQWLKSSDKQSAASMVLKVLAALPGVTRDAVLSSGIGQTLNGIVRLSREGDRIDTALGDLALWVTESWWDCVNASGVPRTTKDVVAEQAWRLKASVLPPLVIAPISTRPAVKHRAAITEQLRQEMSTPLPTPKDGDIPFFLPNYNSLGSVDQRRPQRSIKLLDSLVHRVEENRKESDEEQSKRNDEQLRDNEGIVGVGRLQFGRPAVINYKQDIPPVHLMATTRSKLIARQHAAMAKEFEDDEIASNSLPRPNKQTTPTKSILKHFEIKEPPPLSQVSYEKMRIE